VPSQHVPGWAKKKLPGNDLNWASPEYMPNILLWSYMCLVIMSILLHQWFKQ